MPRTTPDQRRAGGRVWYEIERGRMKPAKYLTCVDCGNPAREYDHYLGYAPEHYLDVEPVCSSCHHKRGIKRGEHPGPPKHWNHGSRPRKNKSLGESVLINPVSYVPALTNRTTQDNLSKGG